MDITTAAAAAEGIFNLTMSSIEREPVDIDPMELSAISGSSQEVPGDTPSKQLHAMVNGEGKIGNILS